MPRTFAGLPLERDEKMTAVFARTPLELWDRSRS